MGDNKGLNQSTSSLLLLTKKRTYNKIIFDQMICQRSSVVEQLFRKEQVVGSIPTVGSASFPPIKVILRRLSNKPLAQGLPQILRESFFSFNGIS
tara:strand:+ start:3541 stop:3825 length:285 start_codon:yes stop_codon:yes gene_type:complete